MHFMSVFRWCTCSLHIDHCEWHICYSTIYSENCNCSRISIQLVQRVARLLSVNGVRFVTINECAGMKKMRRVFTAEWSSESIWDGSVIECWCVFFMHVLERNGECETDRVFNIKLVKCLIIRCGRDALTTLGNQQQGKLNVVIHAPLAIMHQY